MSLDILLNRQEKKYHSKELFLRILWSIVSPLFRFSPRTMFTWRNMLLRAFGAQIGKNVHIYNSAKIYMPWNLEVGNWSAIGEWVLVYNLGKVSIGDKTTISHKAHLCAGTHQYDSPTLPLIKAPIEIGNEVWVCSESFIGPGVHVEDGAVVGARAVAISDVGAWQVVAGNPAKFIKNRNLNLS